MSGVSTSPMSPTTKPVKVSLERLASSYLLQHLLFPGHQFWRAASAVPQNHKVLGGCKPRKNTRSVEYSRRDLQALSFQIAYALSRFENTGSRLT